MRRAARSASIDTMGKAALTLNHAYSARCPMPCGRSSAPRVMGATHRHSDCHKIAMAVEIPKTPRPGRLFFGTSGYVYPHCWERFYPRGLPTLGGCRNNYVQGG